MKPQICLPWPRSSSSEEAALSLLSEMESWIRSSMDRQCGVPWRGVHDEGTFASSWFGYLLLSPDKAIASFLVQLRDSHRSWSQDHEYHGYWPRHEAHHGPENFLYFQSRFAALDAGDSRTHETLEDVVHHVGNWVPGIPEWFDWESRLFRSTILGTREVDLRAPQDINVPDHFRFVLLALADYRLTGETRYLQWAELYTRRWLELFHAGSCVPLAIHASLPPDEVERAYAAVRQAFFAAAPGDVSNPVNRLEAHISSGTLDALMDLYYLTANERYRESARALCEALIPTLGDGHNHPVPLLLMKYRRMCKDTSLDEKVLAQLGGAMGEDPPVAYSLDPDREWSVRELESPGKRRDMICWLKKTPRGLWLEDGSPSPAAWMLAYEITGEEVCAARSLEMATARLRIAQRLFRDGRKNGCADRTVSAVIRGNGRCQGAGNVTGSLYPYRGDVFDVCGIPTRLDRTFL